MSIRYRSFFIFFGAASFISICVLVCCFVFFVFKKSSFEADTYLLVKRNFSDANIADLLCENEISDHRLCAILAVKITKMIKRRKIQMGEYYIPEYASLADALRIISSNKTVTRKITIPEGYSIAEAVKQINNNEFLLGTIQDIPEEGSMLPETYYFKYPTTKQQIISRSQKAMRDFIEKEWPKKSKACILKTTKEALILASIVEKETHLERELVANVFMNRLKINMRLQSCPTVIYAQTIGCSKMNRILYSDLKFKSPYNTYMFSGLPPSPIANPSKASILAILHPTETNYLYFVLDEQTQKHIFAKTFTEHKKNVSFVRKRRLSASTSAIHNTSLPFM